MSILVELLPLFFSSRSLTAVADPSRMMLWVPSFSPTTGPSDKNCSMVSCAPAGQRVEHTLLRPFLELQMHVLQRELVQIAEDGQRRGSFAMTVSDGWTLPAKQSGLDSQSSVPGGNPAGLIPTRDNL